MTNPVFNNSPVFGDPRGKGRGGPATTQAPTWGTATTDAVTLEQVHRLLADTEFVSAKDLAPLVDLRDARPTAEPVQAPVEPGATALPKRR